VPIIGRLMVYSWVMRNPRAGGSGLLEDQDPDQVRGAVAHNPSGVAAGTRRRGGRFGGRQAAQQPQGEKRQEPGRVVVRMEFRNKKAEEDPRPSSAGKPGGMLSSGCSRQTLNTLLVNSAEFRSEAVVAVGVGSPRN